MSFRMILTGITFVLIGVVVYFAWPEILRAWALYDQINIWVLLSLLPVQLLSYYAIGLVIFSYLQAKGDLRGMHRLSMVRIALELNFVNHVFPSGGAAGFSYLGWLLARRGVKPSRIAMSQIVRYVLLFAGFIVVLFVSLIILTLDNNINRVILLVIGAIAFAPAALLAGSVFVLGSKKRMGAFARWTSGFVNKIVRFFTFGKKTNVVSTATISNFFDEIHDDFVEIRRDLRLLKRPFMWTIVTIVADVALIWISFVALGAYVNPATLFVALGVSSILSIFSVTPGGAGVFEAIMIAFLSASGVSADIAIAGTLLARVSLVTGTIVFGYVFYQIRLLRDGKSPA